MQEILVKDSGLGKPYRSFGAASLPQAVVGRFHDTIQLRFARQLPSQLFESSAQHRWILMLLFRQIF